MKEKNHTSQIRILGLLLALLLPFTAAAQAVAPLAAGKRAETGAAPKGGVSVEDYKLSSKLMVREMPYRIVLPANYSTDPQARFPVIYLLHGLTGHYDNWGSKTKIAEYLAPYPVIVVMPEGGDGWYTDSSTKANDRYETYITQELIREIDGKFRTLADRRHRVVAGLSMGGYGSIKYGLKNPEMFSLVGSFSGALGAASWTEKELSGVKWILASIMSVYGEPGSLTRSENDIYKLVRELPAEKVNELPFIYVDCGTEDFLIQNNRDFASLLIEKKVAHEFRQLPGGHTWAYWEAQIQEFLRISQRFFRQSKAKAA